MDGYDDDEKLYQGLTGHPEYNLKPEVHLLLTEMDDSSEVRAQIQVIHLEELRWLI